VVRLRSSGDTKSNGSSHQTRLECVLDNAPASAAYMAQIHMFIVPAGDGQGRAKAGFSGRFSGRLRLWEPLTRRGPRGRVRVQSPKFKRLLLL